MTGRVQSLRSNVAGNRPVVGSQQPGSLYVNWPDRQIGVIDSTQTPMDLVAVRFFSLLASYNAGDFVLSGGQLYSAKAAIVPGAFNATQWNKVTLASDTGTFLPIAGGTLTGALAIAPPSGSVGLTLNKAASGSGDNIYGATAGLNRWVLQLGDGTAESGSNAGSNFSLSAYNDAGTIVGSPALTIARSSGLATVAGDPTSALGIATKQYVDKAPRLITSGSVTSGAANLTLTLPGGYSTYRLLLERFEPVSLATFFVVVSTTNASSWWQAINNYSWAIKYSTSANTEGTWNSSQQTTAAIELSAGQVGAGSGNAASWVIDIYPGSGGALGTMVWQSYYAGAMIVGGAALIATGAVWTNLFIYYSVGNIYEGAYQLYGFN